jgi:hypothetical protein
MSTRKKLYAVLPKHPDLTLQEARDHWRHPHGTLARRIPTMTRYIQSHQISSELVESDDNGRFLGVAEVWVDNLADAAGYATEPTRVLEVEPDEGVFLDLNELAFFWTEEEVLEGSQALRLAEAREDAIWEEGISSVSTKVVQLVRNEGTVPWRGDDDLELGRRIGAFRHARGTAVPELRGDDDPFIGVRELWWPTLSRFERGVKADLEAWRALIDRPANALTMLVQTERIK